MGVTRHIALLRAINVGGHTVTMARLRELFEAMGFTGVETFIASGNVIFESSESDTPVIEQRIESGLRAALGYEVATFIRQPLELATVASYEPFGTALREGSSLYVSFTRAALDDAAAARFAALETAADRFHVHGREYYWLRLGSIVDAKITGAMLERAAGGPGTQRNITTVHKLAARYPP